MRPAELSQAVGIQLGIVVAGFSGGVVSTLFATNLTRMQALGSILASLLFTSYITPMVVAYFTITQSSYQYGSAFLIGLFTMSLVPAVKLIGNRYIAQRVQGLAPPTTPPVRGEEPKS